MSHKIYEEKTFEQLITELPKLLTAPGQTIHLGLTPHEAPFAISRTTVGKTDYWIIYINNEESDAFMMTCCEKADGYVGGLKNFLKNNWAVYWTDHVYQLISNK